MQKDTYSKKNKKVLSKKELKEKITILKKSISILKEKPYLFNEKFYFILFKEQNKAINLINKKIELFEKEHEYIKHTINDIFIIIEKMNDFKSSINL
jgi:hypothetical protein